MNYPKVLLFAAFSGIALPVTAADFSDPTWPCIQRKVERLSIGLMWPTPLEEIEIDPETSAAIADLADQLALRRIALAELEPQVTAFAAGSDGDPQILGRVFERVFNSLSARRTRIITGIGEFSLSQIALAEKIDAARVEMNTAIEAAEPDFDKVDALEEQLDWDQVIYTDRQQSITYLCETPVLLEKRLFAISQMLQQVSRSDG
ncbi:MAG: hypothetical protein AAFQ66_12900 [Pseudomonadota bacterium]